eukprot:Polyplicarium_translucidae@DN814_c0_g1_i2.p1
MNRDVWTLPEVRTPCVDVRDAAALVHLVLAAESGGTQRLACTCDDTELTVREQSACLERAFSGYGFHPKVPRMYDITVSARSVFNNRFSDWAARIGYSYRVSNTRAKQEYHMTFMYGSNYRLKCRLRDPERFLCDHALSLMKFGVLDAKRVPTSAIDEVMTHARTRNPKQSFAVATDDGGEGGAPVSPEVPR